MSILLYAKSINNELVWSNKKALSDYLALVDMKDLVVTIDKEKSVRSMSQNRYYWFYLRIVANETGHTDNELHELFKRIFLPPRFKTILGREVKMPSSTTELNKIQMGEYLELICAETGVPLPDPKLVANLI